MRNPTRNIAVITQAYNAEATIARAIESVLAQTYPYFVYFVLDSASTDGTWRIITDYARRDRRVVPLQNSVNTLTAYIARIPRMIKAVGLNGLFAALDADDAYGPNAFKVLLRFMDEQRLDVSAGECRVLSADTGSVTNDGPYPADVVYDHDKYAYFFPAYLHRVCSVWGKLFSMNVIRQCDFTRAKSLTLGADTAFTLEALKHTTRFGIKGKPVYDYYYSPTSTSHRFIEDAVYDGKNLFDTTQEYLARFGDVSAHNRKYMLRVYLSTISKTVGLMKDAHLDASRMMEYLKFIVNDPLTEEALLLDEIKTEDRVRFLKALFS